MAVFSFDIVSDYDKSELNNVLDQTQREMLNRYDFKGTSANIDWQDGEKKAFKVIADSDFHIEATIDIIRKKIASRNQSQKILDLSQEAITTNLKVTKIIPLKKGLDQEKAKKITGLIRQELPKIKTQIQGEEIRVMSPKKDDLQEAMQLLNSQDFDFALQFTNYR